MPHPAEAEETQLAIAAKDTKTPAAESEESGWLPYLDPLGVFHSSTTAGGPGTENGSATVASAPAADGNRSSGALSDASTAVSSSAAPAVAGAVSGKTASSWTSYLDPLGVFSKDAKEAPSTKSRAAAADTGVMVADSSAASSRSPMEPILRLEDFAVGRVIGIGGSAVVHFATHKSTGSHYALKMQRKKEILKQMKHKDPETRIRERRILPKLDHPFVVGLLGAFQDPSSLYLALEFVPGGELMVRLAEEKKLSTETARFYTAQIVEAFAYLHGQNVVYRSLKPEDVLLAVDGYVKLVDFGFAKELPTGEKTFTLCGTPEYLAPEVILNQGHGAPADWYSLGVLIYEMTVGKPPFQGKDANEVFQSILTGAIKSPATADKAMKALVKGLLHSNPETRIGGKAGAADLRTAAWFEGLSWQDLLEKRLPAPYTPTLQDAGDTSRFPEQVTGETIGDLDTKDDVFLNLW